MLKSSEDTEKVMKSHNRQDLVEKEQISINVIKSYLPDLVPIKEKTAQVVKESGATSVKDMKKVMEST
jgi:uncharacterized protein YqeY